MKYQAIGFDYGGVIESASGRNMMQEAAQLIGVPLPDLRKKYFEHNHRSNVGNLPWIDMWPEILDELGRSHKKAIVRDFFMKFAAENLVDGRMLDLMKELREKGYRIGILSNYTSVLHERLEIQGITSLADAVVCSGDVGYQKPEKEIFEIFAEKLGVTLPGLVYIDDAPKSLETAPELGYTPLLFRGYPKLRKDLASLNILGD